MRKNLWICNDPFETVLEAARQLFPNLKAVILLDPYLKFRRILCFRLGHCGETLFPDDGSDPVIRVSTKIPFEAMVEILAHELAHVAAGVENEHNAIWLKAFKDIHSCFEEIIEAKIDLAYDYGLLKPRGGK